MKMYIFLRRADIGEDLPWPNVFLSFPLLFLSPAASSLSGLA